MRVVMLLLAPLWFYAHAAAVAQSATTENTDSDRMYEIAHLLDDATKQSLTKMERIRLMQDSITIATALSGEREGFEHARLMMDVVQGDPQLRPFARMYQEANSMAIASILACKGDYDASIKIINELKDLAPSAVDFAAHCAIERKDYAEATRVATLTTDVNSLKLMAEIATAEHAGHVDASSTLVRLKELATKTDQYASARYLAIADAGTGHADVAAARLHAGGPKEGQRGTAYDQSSNVSLSLWLADVAVAAYRARGIEEGLRIAGTISERSDRAVALAHMAVLAALQDDSRAAANFDNAASRLFPQQPYGTSEAYEQTTFGMAQDMLILSRARRRETDSAVNLLRLRPDALKGNCTVAAYVASAADDARPEIPETLSAGSNQACKAYMLRAVANQRVVRGAPVATIKHWATAYTGFVRASIDMGIAEGIMRRANPNLFELKYLGIPLQIDRSGSKSDPRQDISASAGHSYERSENAVLSYSVEKASDALFGNVLLATVNGRKYQLIDKSADKCMQVIAQKDFDGDGSVDALVAHVTGCGGNCCSDSFFFVSSLPNGRFEFSKEFGDSWENPLLENWNGRWSVLVAAIDSAGNPTGTKQRFILKNGQAVKVEEKPK